MLKLALLVGTLWIATPLHAQDIVGLEDCAKATSTDKKIGCLQSNVEFLHRLIKKSQDAVQVQLKAAQAQASAAEAKAGELRSEIDRLKGAVERLEKAAPKKE